MLLLALTHAQTTANLAQPVAADSSLPHALMGAHREPPKSMPAAVLLTALWPGAGSAYFDDKYWKPVVYPTIAIATPVVLGPFSTVYFIEMANPHWIRRFCRLRSDL